MTFSLSSTSSLLKLPVCPCRFLGKTNSVRLSNWIKLLFSWSFNYGDKLSQFVVENMLPHQRTPYCPNILFKSFQVVTSITLCYSDNFDFVDFVEGEINSSMLHTGLSIIACWTWTMLYLYLPRRVSRKRLGPGDICHKISSAKQCTWVCAGPFISGIYTFLRCSKLSHTLPHYAYTFCSQGTIAVAMNGVWGSLALLLGVKGPFKSSFFWENPKTYFAFLSVKSKNGSWIHNIYTACGFFRSNPSSDFWDLPPKRVFGKRSEKSIFDKWFSMQKLYSINYIPGNYASGYDKVQN